MARGYPDFSRDAIIRGVDPTGTLKIVGVDEVGRIQGVFYGQDYSSQTLKILGVDAEGNIIARITGRDETGNLKTVLTDADGRLQTVALGKNYQQNIFQPIGVDQNGYLSAVLKGQYGNELRTAAVDSEGRLIVISSDYYEALGQVYRLSLSTIADRLVVRKSIYPVGSIIFYEDFEGLLNRNLALGGHKYEAILTTEKAFIGSHSVKFTFQNDPSAFGSIYYTHSFFAPQIYTYEISFYPNGDYQILRFEIQFYRLDYSCCAILQYYPAQKIITVINEKSQEITVAENVLKPTLPWTWHHACLRVNFQLNKYVWFYLDDMFVDISNIGLLPMYSPQAGFVMAYINFYPNTTTYHGVYFDKFVFGIGD